jgi:hypothetical protein
MVMEDAMTRIDDRINRRTTLVQLTAAARPISKKVANAERSAIAKREGAAISPIGTKNAVAPSAASSPSRQPIALRYRSQTHSAFLIVEATHLPPITAGKNDYPSNN